MRKNNGCLIIFLIVCLIGGYLSRITNEDEIRLSTKKVLTVYPNKKTISLFVQIYLLSLKLHICLNEILLYTKIFYLS